MENRAKIERIQSFIVYLYTAKYAAGNVRFLINYLDIVTKLSVWWIFEIYRFEEIEVGVILNAYRFLGYV